MSGIEKSEGRYVFGPVPSRRLGRSLGVDLVPWKTCTYDCVYCQLSKTTQQTCERREWAPVDEVMAQLREKLARERPDYITLSGSGEPTLHSGIGRVVNSIREMSDIPIVVLTNGYLLRLPEVRQALLKTDIVCPTLAAASDDVLNTINRPPPGVGLRELVDGMVAFRNEYSGQIWLEVMILAGINSDEEHVRGIAELAREIRPDKIQLNTPVRPPLESFALPVPVDRLNKLAGMFEPTAEVIGEYRPTEIRAPGGVSDEDLLEMIGRHPSTMDEISGAFNADRKLVAEQLAQLATDGKVRCVRHGDRMLFKSA